LAQHRQERAQLECHWEQQVQHATYEAHLARRRYEAVDPGNRLVAVELERCWEERLVALRETQETAERFSQQAETPALDDDRRFKLPNSQNSLRNLGELRGPGVLCGETLATLYRGYQKQ